MEKIYENMALVATIDPDAYATGTQGSDWVDMSVHRQVMFTPLVGDLGSSAVLNVKLQEATSNAGAGKQDISGKAITALTQAGTDSDKQAHIHLQADELSAGYRYARALATLTVATSDYGLVAFASRGHYKPAKDYDLASVDEIVD